ncbi:MAG TPA: hypothetical protein VFZ66_13990 [Herpetosiphonaceae bacterium]
MLAAERALGVRELVAHEPELTDAGASTKARARVEALALGALERFARPPLPEGEVELYQSPVAAGGGELGGREPSAAPTVSAEAPNVSGGRTAPRAGKHRSRAQSGKQSQRKASADGAPVREPGAPSSLTRNPRALAYWVRRCRAMHAAVAKANREADRRKLSCLEVPRQAFDLCHDFLDDTRAIAGALEWVRKTCGAGIALEVEAAGLYRVPGQLQRDDWAAFRARRKVALIVFLLMSPFELPRSAVTGSTSDEPLVVTCGVPQTLLVLMLRSALREPYNVRTLQRDLAEIDECTDLLQRWRTPRAKCEPFECRGQAEGVINRYCIRAGLIRTAWRRASDATEALIKQTRLQMASWLVWTPPPRRGEAVPICGSLAPPAAV